MKMFSIIVPIYKIERYIEECIQSVVNQTYKNYELILVDDGSPDNCGKICDKYKNIYSSIKVVHKENGGVSSARNAGITIAEGEYIIFLDGDDILTKDCLNEISRILNNKKIDLLSCNYSIYGNNRNINEYIEKKVDKLNDYFNYISDIPWAVWRNIYNRELIVDNNIMFDESVGMAEDCAFFLECFENANSIVFANIDVIQYRNCRDNSLTNNISFNAIINQLDVFSKYFYKYYNENNKIIYETFAKKYLNTITTIYNIKNNQQIEEIYENIKNNKLIFKYAKGTKYQIAKLIWMIFGYKNGSKIINILK